MKIINKLLAGIIFLAGTSLLINQMQNITNEKPILDNTVYDDETVIDYREPTFVYEPNKAAAAINKIVIHYHDDDGRIMKNGELQRAFWFWSSGWAPDKEFLPDDGYTEYDLTITLDCNDELFAPLAKKSSLSFIIKNKSSDPTAPTWSWQTTNTELKFEEYPPVNGVVEVWTNLSQGMDLGIYESEEKSKMTGIKNAYFSSWNKISVENSALQGVTYSIYAYGKYALTNFSILTSAQKNKCLFKTGHGEGASFDINLNTIVHPNALYVIESYEDGKPDCVKYANITFERLYTTERFKSLYQYNGELGAIYSPNETTFRLWAPTAGLVRLCLYESGIPSDFPNGSDSYGGYKMSYRQGGVWEVTIKNKDLHGKYYNYQVRNSNGNNIVVDPYAKACGINGVRGMVVNFDYTNPTGWDEVPSVWNNVDGYDISSPQDLSIYEIHIRDLTSDETWVSNNNNARGTYNAFSEKGTTYTEDDVTVKTGFDHIEEMGVNAIQILPVFDSDNSEDPENNKFNWGYNPLNYNCVEGAYSSNPFSGTTRINEFKNLIKSYALNKNHTRVIMDVVYNHVNSASDSNFNKIMPKYYFRFDETFTTYMDGSGCGNEVKSEAPMMRKFIIDSLVFWAQEYKIKGFRFDLMGLLDVETLNQAKKALYAVDPDIYIYGEGWTAAGYHGEEGSYSCDSSNVYSMCYDTNEAIYLGAFNDAGRNALKGENGLDNAWGFISQGAEHVGSKSSIVADMIAGYHTGKGGNPRQTINYASCHDNFTLFDQLSYTIGEDGKNPYYPGIAIAATAAVECTILFSNGVAFIQGGEELFRSKEISDEELATVTNAKNNAVKINGKNISHNSYNLGDFTNSFKWDRKISIDGVKTTPYINEIIKAVELRKTLTKYSYEELQKNNPYDSNSPFNIWNYGDGSTCIGVKNGNYFFFLSGCNDQNIPFGAYDSEGYNEQVFCSNPVGGGFSHPETGYIRLGWGTCVCLTNS